MDQLLEIATGGVSLKCKVSSAANIDSLTEPGSQTRATVSMPSNMRETMHDAQATAMVVMWTIPGDQPRMFRLQ